MALAAIAQTIIAYSITLVAIEIDLVQTQAVVIKLPTVLIASLPQPEPYESASLIAHNKIEHVIQINPLKHLPIPLLAASHSPTNPPLNHQHQVIVAKSPLSPRHLLNV